MAEVGRGKTILLVGGAGYVGSHTAKVLREKGYQVVVFDNLSTGHLDAVIKRAAFRKGDIRIPLQLLETFETFQPAAVIHFAALAYVGDSIKTPAPYYDTNVAGTLNLLKRCLEFENIPVIFSSSCAIYGDNYGGHTPPVTEDTPKAPMSPYGRSKLMVEQILADYAAAYNLRHVNLRYFNAAGADPEGELGEVHDPETHLLPLAIHAAMGKGALAIHGHDYDTSDGTCIRDYVHVTDLAQAHWLALEYLLAHGRSDSFNLGNERGHSILEVVNTVERVTGTTVPLYMAGRREGDAPCLISDSTKARERLGWKPEYNSLETIVETAWNWHKKPRTWA